VTANFTWQKLLGLEESKFDEKLTKHRSRVLDRTGVFLIVVGSGFVLIALFGGDIWNLQAGDWIGAGSVFVAAGGLLLSFGPRSNEASSSTRQ
jgi:hypothetical protein